MSGPIQDLFIELHQRTSQLVCFPCAGPGCLATKAVLENWLQVRRADSLQLLPVWVAKAPKQIDRERIEKRL